MIGKSIQKYIIINLLKKNNLWYNPMMEFIIGFFLGYFLKEISSYLKRLSNYDLDNNINKEWDFLSHDDLP